jgi:hypothetical protein
VQAPIRLVSTLGGELEVPPVVTAASGAATFQLSADRSRLRYTVDVTGIPPALILQAHLHVAPAGVNGPVVLFLAGGPPASLPLRGELSAADLIPRPDVGVIDFPSFVDRLLDGDVYVNVHTQAHMAGEIRGQLAAPQSFPAVLTGQQEVPPVVTSATGRARFTLNAERTVLRFALTTDASQILQAHLHAAPRGFNGPVIFFLASGSFGPLLAGVLTEADLIPNADAGIGSFEEFVEALGAGDVYANVHTMAHPGGEVRGQLLAPTTFTTEISGAEEVPPIGTTASGRSRIVLAPDALSFSAVVVTDLSAHQITQAHIHVGPRGMNGPPAFFLAESGFVSPRLVTLTPADFLPSAEAPTYQDFLAALRAGNTYVNVHTATFPDGEIRGQVRAPVTLAAMLSGGQEVPPVVTAASGRGQVVINADRDRLRFALAVTDLPADQITQAHIHVAPAGMNGGVAFFLADDGFSSPLLGTLAPEDFLSPPEAPTFAEFVAALLGGGTYMNVHSMTQPDGEIRGQLE